MHACACIQTAFAKNKSSIILSVGALYREYAHNIIVCILVLHTQSYYGYGVHIAIDCEEEFYVHRYIIYTSIIDKKLILNVQTVNFN